MCILEYHIRRNALENPMKRTIWPTILRVLSSLTNISKWHNSSRPSSSAIRYIWSTIDCSMDMLSCLPTNYAASCTAYQNSMVSLCVYKWLCVCVCVAIIHFDEFFFAKEKKIIFKYVKQQTAMIIKFQWIIQDKWYGWSGTACVCACLRVHGPAKRTHRSTINANWQTHDHNLLQCQKPQTVFSTVGSNLASWRVK